MIDLQPLDQIIILLYFAVVFGIAFWAMRKKSDATASTDYFLGGRNIGWFAVGASLFASNIGSEHLIGLAGSGYAGGVAVAQYEVWAGIILLLLGWVFVPFYLNSKVSTMPEFLERRYSKGSRTYLAVISVIGYVLTKISVTIFAGGVILEVIGIDFWWGALILVLATGLYTALGGLKAVVYTDLMQAIVLIGGAITVTIFGYNAVGGWQPMVDGAGDGFFQIWRPLSDPDFPWTGILLGAPILGVWYWCTDQFIVQRVLSAKNIHQARRGTIFAGYLKMLPLFIFVIPGIMAYILVQQNALEVGSSNQALPVLIKELLPIGLRGLVVAGLFAALMSSLSSVFNSCSTLLTFDFYKRWSPAASERQLVWFGRASTGALVILGLLWIPVIRQGVFSDQLFIYLQSVQAYIAPPIASVFLLGLFYKRLNGSGALASLLGGFVIGGLRFTAELLKSNLNPEGVIYWFADINFLHFALWLFVICSAILVVVSLATAKPEEAQVKGLTFGQPERKALFQGYRTEVIASIGLLLVIAAIWILF